MGGGGLHGDLELHHRFGQGRAAGYGEGQRGEQLVNSVSLSLSLKPTHSLSLKVTWVRDLDPLFCFDSREEEQRFFFFSRFFLFSFNSELKKKCKMASF